MILKKVIFLGNSLQRIRAFPFSARQDAGFQIDSVQRGESPDDWKPINSVGKGVREIRIKHASNQYRVIYLAKKYNAIYVLHAFQKKTRKTLKSDIELARKRLNQIGHQNE